MLIEILHAKSNDFSLLISHPFQSPMSFSVLGLVTFVRIMLSGSERKYFSSSSEFPWSSPGSPVPPPALGGAGLRTHGGRVGTAILAVSETQAAALALYGLH